MGRRCILVALVTALMVAFLPCWAQRAWAGYYTVDSDLTVTVAIEGRHIDDYIRRKSPKSPLIGLGQAFVKAGNKYGIDAAFLVALGIHESGWGTNSLARDKNNIYSWGAYDSCPYECALSFDTKEECIDIVAGKIKELYLSPGGRYYTPHGPTLHGMNVHYATDQNWKYGILRYMNELAVTIPDYPPAPTASTATVLVLDISGSMDDSHQGRRKIDAAKDAATNIINMIEQESQVGEVSHQLAIATFSTDAWLNLPLTTDYAQAKDIVAGIEPTNRTNIGAALSVANQALQSAPTGSQKIAILLSDGLTNEGLPPEGILSGPVQDAAHAGACIYTVGFGDPGDLDEDLLRRIAETIGCKYYYAPDAYQLENIYIKVRHESLGNVIGQFSGQVAQGDTVTAGQVEVPPNQGELYVTLNWPGSTLDLIITDPKGRRVEENYPGVTISTYAKMVYVILANPTPGIWQTAVFGRDVPEGLIDYNAILSVRERVITTPSDQGVILLALMLILGLGGVLAIVITQATRRPAHGVRVVQGYGPGGFIGFRRGMINIGRDSRSELVLWDNKVSRYHAQIRLERGWPIIYDLNSMNGTLVNGQRVTSQPLRNGDKIRVGDTRLVFQGRW